MSKGYEDSLKEILSIKTEKEFHDHWYGDGVKPAEEKPKKEKKHKYQTAKDMSDDWEYDF